MKNWKLKIQAVGSRQKAVVLKPLRRSRFQPGHKLKAEDWRLRTGFTLVELMIVVAVLGILAAIVIPEFQGHIQQAKESAAKDTLRILRETIGRYAAENNNPPGTRPGTSKELFAAQFMIDLITNDYLPTIPDNPLNEKKTIDVYFLDNTLPEEASGDYGWIYNLNTGEIRVDYPGMDTQGIEYYSY